VKDNFSTVAAQYAKFRPTYPEAMLEYICSLVKEKDRLWDCGTGSGQMAVQLSPYFREVYATDISANQLENATRRKNIHYSLQPAESTNFPAQHFDMITVAQALHWFNFEKFYTEVRRTLKPDGVLVASVYNLVRTGSDTDPVLDHFYQNIVGPYWDAERRHIDHNYSTIPFPFREIQAPQFFIEQEWTLQHFAGYLGTWSAIRHFKEKNNYDPVPALIAEMTPLWPAEATRTVRFPVTLRIGRL